MFWVLLALIVFLSLALLALTLLTLWRRVKVLGRSVTAVGTTVAEASDALQISPVAREKACPTCGAPASAAVPRSASVSR